MSNRSSNSHGRQAKHTKSTKTTRNLHRENLSGAEIQEIVSTSFLVPVEGIKADTRVKMETVTPATTAPSSVVPSPLVGVVDAEAESWPTLREAVTGWEFCSERSESEESDMWETLPEPAIDVNSDEEFLNVSNKDVPEPIFSGGEGEAPRTLAEILRKQLDVEGAGCQPPMFGTRIPAHTSDACSTSCLFKAPCVVDDECDQCEVVSDFRMPGWSKDHKASWNKQYQRKVAGKSSLRAQQSARSKGSLEDESDEEPHV
mmetsp:Transcript_9560/g.15628  ORF Transcript_9560/g.15628 Transcript_9560/m.15628 type:complete len:259 (+) Transcript_9560:81-857(+)